MHWIIFSQFLQDARFSGGNISVINLWRWMNPMLLRAKSRPLTWRRNLVYNWCHLQRSRQAQGQPPVAPQPAPCSPGCHSPPPLCRAPASAPGIWCQGTKFLQWIQTRFSCGIPLLAPPEWRDWFWGWERGSSTRRWSGRAEIKQRVRQSFILLTAHSWPSVSGQHILSSRRTIVRWIWRLRGPLLESWFSRLGNLWIWPPLDGFLRNIWIEYWTIRGLRGKHIRTCHIHSLSSDGVLLFR